MKKLKGGLAAGLMLGNLGFKVKGVKAQDILNDREYFAEILARNKMIGFIGLNPTLEEHLAILKALYLGDNEEPPIGLIEEQKHQGNPNTMSDDHSSFIRSQWHVDNPFQEKVPSYTSMHMEKFALPSGVGSTIFASLVMMYEMCPEHFRKELETTEFVHATGSVEYFNHANESPEKSVGSGSYAHPALRTHPYTGETMIFWTGGDTRPSEEKPWFASFQQWVDHFLSDGRNWYRWDWSEGDLIIWDNRAVIHSFDSGWEHHQRVFSRGDAGMEAPFYEPGRGSRLNPAFGDVIRHSSVAQDRSVGPNPDHIPLVFTKGIYALPEFEHLFQQTTMFVYSNSGELPEDVIQLKESVDNPEFNIIAVKPTPGNFLERFSKSYLAGIDLEGQKFLFTPNGDLEKAYAPSDDLFTDQLDDQGRWPPKRLIEAFGEFHPDLRHAGHAWHYPDWFPHQPLKNRPWDWHNLSFTDYEGFPGSQPPEDFLVQFAIDTVYGCFNHLKTNEERKQIIDRILDYLNYMVELREYEVDR